MTELTEVSDQPRGAKDIKPKWKNAPTRSDLHADYTAAENGQSAFKAKLLGWKETRAGGPDIITAGTGKSTTRPLLVRKQNEWKYPSLEDPLLSTSNLFKISPTTPKDTLAAKQNGRVLNYQWNTKIQKTKLVGDIIRTVVDEGTVIVKTGWDAKTEIRLVEEEVPTYASVEESLMLMREAIANGSMSQEQAQAMLETGEPMKTGTAIEMVEREVLVRNQPTYEVCITANVTVDPTCNGVASEARFIIHEFSTSYAELVADEYSKDAEGNESGFYHNLDSIVEDTNDIYDPMLSDESNNFKFRDKARKRLKAYEYWGYWDIQGDGVLVGIVATWIGAVLVRLEENPFPHGRLPFSIAPYMPVVKSVHGEPDAELLKENQDAIGKMTRAIHDITAKQAVGQEFIDENFFPSASTKNQYEKGNTVYYRSGFDPRNAIYRRDVQPVGSTPFDVIQWQGNEANELTGTRAFSGPGGAKMGGSENDRNSMDATAKRDLSILRRLSDLLFVDMGRLTIAMNQAFLSEEEVIRITDTEFVTVNRDDLQGDFDLKVQVSTPERDEDQANKLWKLLQTNAATMDEGLVKLHYVQLSELWGFESLAEAVSSYESQPDPQQQEMKALQIEEQKLKNAILMRDLEDKESKIAERLSRASENTYDNDLKAAKTAQTLAVAAKVESETDLLNSQFVRIESGQVRMESIQDQEYAATTEAAVKQLNKAIANMPAKTISEV